MNNKIVIKGAKEHNLKNIDLEIPRDKLVVITGLSGSRKIFISIYVRFRRSSISFSLFSGLVSSVLS